VAAVRLLSVRRLSVVCDVARYPHESNFSSIFLHHLIASEAYSGGGAMVRLPPPLGLTVNFWIIFAVLHTVSVVSRLNCKIRISSLLMTVGVFYHVNNCVKMHPNLSFCAQNFFYGKGPSSLHHTPPSSTPTASRPHLTEILNTPLNSLWIRTVCVKTIGKKFEGILVIVQVHWKGV